MYRLLLIDDDLEVLRIHDSFFTSKGYTVSLAENAEKGLAQLKKHPFDCILLDIMIPGINGFEAYPRIRAETDAPVLFLTGRLDEESAVRGLMSGADDYITKPCGLAELEARILACIRRHTKSATSAAQPLRLSIPPLEIDIAAHQAYCDGESLQLTGREYDILYLLAVNKGKTVTYEQIANQMWGTFREDDRRSVMVSVSRLRKKLELHSALPEMIETVWSEGYTLTERDARG